MILLACLSGGQVVGMVLGLAGMITVLFLTNILCKCFLNKKKIDCKKEENEQIVGFYKKEEKAPKEPKNTNGSN